MALGFPCESSLPGHLPGTALSQPSLFPKAVATFMPQLLQKMHEFISAELTCNKRHYIGWKEKPLGQERWASLVPGPRRHQPILNRLQLETEAEAASLVPCQLWLLLNLMILEIAGELLAPFSQGQV